ncbi:MAG: fructose-bisphosphatase class II, partial [Propionibacteriaceae bacterium]|nr:fructose-bisphosphatase class II [Propionibacteriaceae bacterium]
MRQTSLLPQAFLLNAFIYPRSTYVDRTLIQEILEIVEQAAIASATLSGKGL